MNKNQSIFGVDKQTQILNKKKIAENEKIKGNEAMKANVYINFIF